MASFRPDTSRAHNTGRNSGITIDERQQRQYFQNAAATRANLPANARPPPGFGLGGPGPSSNPYRPQQQAPTLSDNYCQEFPPVSASLHTQSVRSRRGFGLAGPGPSPNPYTPHNNVYHRQQQQAFTFSESYFQDCPAPQRVSASHNTPVQVTPSLHSGGSNITSQRLGTTSTAGERGREGEEGLQLALTDRFGMRGLMEVLSGRDPNVRYLGLGIDRETLDSYDNYYFSNNFPWSARTSNPEPQYQLPQCYIGNVPIPRLNAQTVSQFKLETIFYMFYSSPNDEAQLLAANELHERGWVYHKQMRVWLTRSGSEEDRIKTDTHERGCYVYFDPKQGTFLREDDFTVVYNMLERRPLPPQP